MKNLIVLIVLAFACSGISFTITVTSIFGAFRQWVGSFGPKWDQLIHCPWCISHYVMIALFILFQDQLQLGWLIQRTGSLVLDVVIVLGIMYACITLSGLLHHVLLRAYEPVARTMALRKLDQMKAKKVNTQQDGKVNL